MSGLRRGNGAAADHSMRVGFRSVDVEGREERERVAERPYSRRTHNLGVFAVVTTNRSVGQNEKNSIRMSALGSPAYNLIYAGTVDVPEVKRIHSQNPL